MEGNKNALSAVRDFLTQNNLRTLKFRVARDEYKKYFHESNFPVFLSVADGKSRLAYIEKFTYDHKAESLKIKTEEIVKYIETEMD